MRIRNLAVLLLAALLGGTFPNRSLAAAGSPSKLNPFFEQHCLKCHGPEKQKGDLRLDTLAPPSADKKNLEVWRKVVEAIDSGDMPPKKEARPDAAAIKAVLHSIGDAMAKAPGARPAALRRLNRMEYENTVHDLLGIDTPLADLLPEDGSVQGFDNVANGLSISTVLMERYLEAADVAFESVIRRIKPLPPAARRAVMMENKDNIDSVEKKKGGTIEVENSFVKFAPGWPPARLDSAHPIEEGIYRCRIAAWPHEPGERTLAVAIYVGALFGPGKLRPMGVFDVTGTPAEPRIIEFTAHMMEGEALHIVPRIYPEHITYRDKHEARPGIGLMWAETYGPLDQDFPSPAQRRLFGNSPTISMAEGNPVYMRNRKGMKQHNVVSSQPAADAERIIREFAPRAFRRPVEKAVIDSFVKLTLDRLNEGRTFEQAVRAGVSSILCSPYFLLINREPKPDDYTLASRLSYFLWSTLPDEELTSLAAKGQLKDPKVMHAQVERMIKDPRRQRFVENFTGQWLNLRDIEFTTPDAKLYPEFEPLLQEAMLAESRGFFAHILTNDLSVANFIGADFTVLNERLAKHYGITGVKGHETFRVVPLPKDSIRGGVLAQAAVMKVTANGTTTSPVLRGAWVLNKVLGQPAPPPPAGVPAVEPDIRGATTIRAQLDKHRADESCARCHARIDPPGFALEVFDPIGGYRDRYRSLGSGDKVKDQRYKLGLKIETDGTMPDGKTFANFIEFRQQLLSNRERVARAIAAKLLVYATGRPITAADRTAVDDVVARSQQKDLGLRSMIHAVVDSELFQQP
jgi:mono/diheme cytochrome c family protein